MNVKNLTIAQATTNGKKNKYILNKLKNVKMFFGQCSLNTFNEL